MLPNVLLFEIAKYCKIYEQMQIFTSNKYLYNKSENIRMKYKKWWNMYVDNDFKSIDKKFIYYILLRGINKWGLYEDIITKKCAKIWAKIISIMGNIDKGQLMIYNTATWFDRALFGACCSSIDEEVNFLLNINGINVNCGLMGACMNNRTYYIQLMINKGATNWHDGLYYACLDQCYKSIKMMVNMGAKYCSYCRKFHKKLNYFYINVI